MAEKKKPEKAAYKSISDFHKQAGRLRDDSLEKALENYHTLTTRHIERLQPLIRSAHETFYQTAYDHFVKEDVDFDHKVSDKPDVLYTMVEKALGEMLKKLDGVAPNVTGKTAKERARQMVGLYKHHVDPRMAQNVAQQMQKKYIDPEELLSFAEEGSEQTYRDVISSLKDIGAVNHQAMAQSYLSKAAQEILNQHTHDHIGVRNLIKKKVSGLYDIEDEAKLLDGEKSLGEYAGFYSSIKQVSDGIIPALNAGVISQYGLKPYTSKGAPKKEKK